MRKVNTERFGEVNVDEDKVVRFEEGLPAFEDEHEFLVIPYDGESPYYFMQSLTTPELAFLMTVPFVFFPDYEFEMEDDVQAKLGIKTQEEIVIYTLITIPRGKVEDMTANLMAPVVINTTNMKAEQVVLGRSRYTTKHRLFPEKEES